MTEPAPALFAQRPMPTRELALTADSVYGYKLDSIQVGYTWRMAPTALLKVQVWVNGASAWIDHTGFDFGAPSTSGVLTTITAALKSDPTCIFTLYIEKEDRGFALWWSLPEGHATVVQRVEFPRTDLIAPGDKNETFAHYGFFGGCTIFRPHIFQQFPTGFAIPSRDIPLLAFWDSETKAIFYSYCDDEEGNGLGGEVIGQGDSALLVWIHQMDRRYDVGKGFDRPYKVHIESFAGKSLDGNFCYDDIHDRFAEWAASPLRPWIAKGLYKDRVDLSRRARDLEFLWVGGAERTDHLIMRDDMLNLKAHLISGGVPMGEMIYFDYNWSVGSIATSAPAAPDYFGGTPAQPLNANLLAMIDAIQQTGFTYQIYTVPRLWSSHALLAGNQFDPINFAFTLTDPLTGASTVYTFGDLAAYAMRQADGQLHGGNAATVFGFDFTFAEVQYIMYEVLRRYYAAFTGATKPKSIYLDVEPGDPLSFDGQDSPNRPNWTYRDQLAGQLAGFEYIRNFFRRAHDPDMMISCEGPDMRVIPYVDLIYSSEGDNRQGVRCHGLHYVFGRHTQIADYQIPVLFAAFEVFSKVLYPLIQATTIEFMHSSLICMTSRSDGTFGLLVETPIDGSHTLDPLWDWYKVLHEARPRLLKYVQGRHLRDAGGNSNSIRREMVRQREFGQSYWLLYNGGRFHTQSCVRKADDGDVGVILANTYKAGMPLAFYPTPETAAQLVTITLDTVVHDLPVGLKNLYSTNILTGERSYIAAFTHAITFEWTVPPFTVALLEVSTA